MVPRCYQPPPAPPPPDAPPPKPPKPPPPPPPPPKPPPLQPPPQPPIGPIHHPLLLRRRGYLEPINSAKRKGKIRHAPKMSSRASRLSSGGGIPKNEGAGHCAGGAPPGAPC